MTQKLRYFCTLLLMAVVGVAWADEETLDFSAQGYANNQEISTVEAENFSVTFNKGTNSNAPKYYTTGTAIRVYGGGYFTVSSDNTITGITITFGSGGGSNAITTDVDTYSDGTWSGSANSVTFTVGGSNGHRRIASITVTYEASGSSTTLEDNDLALTGAPVALTFDLYDNVEPQVINYTTSSTGAVTIPASNFFETAIDETNKTITVTPVAVTNGVKEAAVNQAADDTYKAGSASFTVDITDSTPFAGGDVTFDAKTDFGNTTAGEGSITKNGVIFSCDNGILGNGNEYRLYKNSTITFSTTSGSITKIEFICKSGNPASGFGEQTGFTLDGNNGTWVGDAESISFVASNKQVQATQIVVTVTMPGDDPYISANNMNVAYDATEGEIEYVVKNPDNGTIVASCESDWLEVDDTESSATEGTILFLCDENPNKTARTATVTLTYTYGTESVTKEVTITQAANPNVVDKIETITAVGDYVVKGTVVAKSNKGFIIGDGTGFIYTYLSATPTWNVGDIVRISGTTGTYGNVIQFTSTATITEETESDYTPMTPAKMTEVPDYSEGLYTSDYYQFIGTLTKNGNNYFVTVGNSDLQISYPSSAQTSELSDFVDKTVKMTGYFAGNNSNNYFTVVMESVESGAVSVTIKDGFKATTFSCDKALDFSAVEGIITAFIITDEKGATSKVTTVPANTGLYIERGDTDGTISYDIPFLANESEADPVTGNKLIPTDGTEFKSDESKSTTYYVFGKQNGKEAFYKVPTSGYTPSANKAVLVVNTPASSAKEMIVIGGDVTGIESIENGTIVNDNYYTIDGKLVKGQPTQKGIYVVNGRKVVIK